MLDSFSKMAGDRCLVRLPEATALRAFAAAYLPPGGMSIWTPSIPYQASGAPDLSVRTCLEEVPEPRETQTEER